MDGDHTKNTLPNRTPFKTSVLGLKVENDIGKLVIDSNNCWSKLESQLNYLSSPPTCFIILSKPGLGEKTLGDRIAEYWNCIHINPDYVIEEQINLKSDTGRCLEFNLRCGNVITIEVILKLIEESMKTDVVHHRGYVLSGIPLVETYKSNDCCGELFSEEAFLTVENWLLDLMSTVNQILESLDAKSERGEEVEEDEEPIASIANVDTENLLPKLTIDYSTKFSGIIPLNEERDFCRKTSVLEQIDMIVNFKTPPTVIINISCPEADIITLRGQNVLIYPKCNSFQMPFESDTVCTRNEDKNYEKIIPIITLYQCWRPSDFSHFVESQFKKMNKRLKSAIKQYITLHNPQFVIYLDGRCDENTNFEVVKTKISIMPLHRVMLPALIQDFRPKNPGSETEVNNIISSKDFLEEFEGKEKLAPHFPYSESLWKTKCPVALADRRCVIGTPKNAVILFDHIFFLSTYDALQAFCRNPRPFLRSEYLTPTCRIAIVGTTKSGKSTLAKCLSWLFSGVVIDFKRFGPKIVSQKEHTILNLACEDALNLLMKVQEDLHLEKENLRLAALEQWKLETLQMLERYAELEESEVHDLLLKFKSTEEIVSFTSKSKSSSHSQKISSGTLSTGKNRSLIDSEQPSEAFSVSSKYQKINSVTVSAGKKGSLIGSKIPSEANSVSVNNSEKISSATLTSSKKGSFIGSKKPSEANAVSSNSQKISSATLSTGKKSSSIGNEQLSVANIVSSTGSLKWIVKNVFCGIVDDSEFIEFCQNAVKDPDVLLQFAPSDIKLASIIETPSEEEILRVARELVKEEGRYDEVTATDDEIIDMLVTKINSLNQNRDPHISGDSKNLGWIIDGMSCESQFWDALIEHNCLPDDVFSLTENTNIDIETFLRHKSRRKDYRSLNSIFDKMQEPLLELHQSSAQFHSKSSVIAEISRMITTLLEHDYFEDNMLRNIPSEMTAESQEALKTSELDTFVKEVEQFNFDYKNLKSLLEACLIDPIEITIPSAWSPSELISESLKLLRYRYGVNCKTPIPEIEVVEDEENTPTSPNDKMFYGINGPFCPVTFYKHAVLWKGREDFVQNYKQKTYYMASLQDQDEFVSDPEHFLQSEIPIEPIPPWRMCITGPIGSGRSTMAKLLAEKMGIIYVNFCNFAFSCLLQSAQDNSRDFYNWLDEPGISKIIDELKETPSEIELVTISQLKDYFVNGLPLPSDVLSGLLSKLWFTEPFCSTGIILDGFPCSASEMKTVKDYFYIPDLIIEIRTSFAEVNNRLYKLNCLQWKNQQKARRDEYEIEKENAFKIWNSHRYPLFIAYFIYLEVENSAFIMIDSALKDSQNNSLIGENYHEEPNIEGEASTTDVIQNQTIAAVVSSEPFYTRTDSNLSIGTRSEFSELSESTMLPLFDIPDDEIEYVTIRVDTAFPKPEFENEWESEENAFERIKARLEEWYESDMAMLLELKDVCEEELLPWLQVDSVKRNERTLKIIERHISEMKPRNESFFEQTTVIDIELAGLLLSKGFYFLSKFGVSCPVRVYEDESLVQMFLQDKNNNNVFPVLHRSYVYFCSGNDNCLKFCKNPLMFIYSSKIDTIVHFPIRLAITGPPKSGRTTLCKRFQEEFGISIRTIGQSLRWTLERFPWTALALQIRDLLSEAETLSSDLIMQAVKLSSVDVTSLTSGVVLDGFPQKTGGAIFMTNAGIFPYLIIKMKCSEDICVEYLQTEPEYYDSMPRYSSPLLSHWFKAWKTKNKIFLLTVRQHYQNLEVIDASWSKWRIWWEAKKYFNTYMTDIVRFLINSPGSAIPIGRLCITCHEFDSKCSHLKDYCPTCLSKGVLRRNEVFNRIGLLQWNYTFYWFCQEHCEEFLKSPYAIELSTPISLPERIYELRQKQFYENGRCIVTFSDNYPTRKIVSGSLEFAATYKGINYLFADAKCLTNFLEEPEKYCDKAIHFETETPLVFFDVSQLPALGYLEQCLSDMIIKATVYVAKIRPKYPGLTPAISSAILVGLFLKCNNPKMTPEGLEIYEKIKADFESKCRMTKDYLDFMNLNDNPFLDKQVCCAESDTYSIFSETTIESSPLQSRQISSEHSNEMEG